MNEKDQEEAQKAGQGESGWGGKEKTQGGQDKEMLLRMSEVGLMLEDYDYIFSDFDPRQYSERLLSDDFLYEAKKAIRDKPSGRIQLNLLVAADKRNLGHEAIIKKRIREHFKKHLALARKETRDIIKRGLFFTLVGVIVMLFATFILFKYQNKDLLSSFLVVLLDPAGWFLFWEGMHMIIFDSKRAKPDLEFNEKMADCDIRFLSY
ncbi:MAG: hypothetical protein MSIBF_06400 [Candidatus Altiarchaeales archaeon IMC4]|nr:MAG: hypothetical protein MSIBF_06400 [Candidatus Altiarchaeales archaeon IMC4]